MLHRKLRWSPPTQTLLLLSSVLPTGRGLVSFSEEETPLLDHARRAAPRALPASRLNAPTVYYDRPDLKRLDGRSSTGNYTTAAVWLLHKTRDTSHGGTRGDAAHCSSSTGSATASHRPLARVKGKALADTKAPFAPPLCLRGAFAFGEEGDPRPADRETKEHRPAKAANKDGVLRQRKRGRD